MMNKISSKIKILLVINDEMMRILLRDIFWIHGRSDIYEISTASSIKEAEKMVLEEGMKPDTVFLDEMMPVPGENNSPDSQVKRTLSFIEELKKDKDLSSTKIIIYSGQKEKSIEAIFQKAGVTAYLIKGELLPKDIIDFTDKIHELHN